MKCHLCKKWELDPQYAVLKDTVGNAYCFECYRVIGGQI